MHQRFDSNIEMKVTGRRQEPNSFNIYQEAICTLKSGLLNNSPKWDVYNRSCFGHARIDNVYGTVKHDGAVAVILAADFMLKKVSNSNIWWHFLHNPPIVYQLFTLFVSFRSHCIPAIETLTINVKIS